MCLIVKIRRNLCPLFEGHWADAGWVRLAAGVRRLCDWVRRDPPGPPAGESDDVPAEGSVDRLEEVAALGQGIWTRPLGGKDLGDWGEPLLGLPRTPRSAQVAKRVSPLMSPGADGWTFAHPRAWPPCLFVALADFLLVVEAAGRWPPCHRRCSVATKMGFPSARWRTANRVVVGCLPALGRTPRQ